MSAAHLYSTQQSRNLIRAERAMLRHAGAIEVLGQFGDNREQPLNQTDTIMFRRLNPWNMRANGTPDIAVKDFVLQEGVNPQVNRISYTDVPTTLAQYGVVFGFSSKVQLMYEDDVPADMSKLTGETLAEVAEMIRYGQLRGGINVIYATGTSRAQVTGKINLPMLRLAARTLEDARARMVTNKLSAGASYDTSAIEPGYLVFCHTNGTADIRDLPGFVPCTKYASGAKVHAREIGAVEDFRFISSPLFRPWLGAGGANAGMVSTGANVDVYPFIVAAQDAWGQVALKGKGAIKPVVLPATTVSHANVLGQMGYVGAQFWTAVVRLNENWMVRLEAGVSRLAAA